MAVAIKQRLDLAHEKAQVGRHGTTPACRPARREVPQAARPPGLDAACARLVGLANARGGDDNITVIVAGVSGDMPPLAPRESLSDTFSVIKEFDAKSH